MRLLSLELQAFGPFTDTVLDLSEPGLHVVHGPNEAGKSTARRALAGLLFGIPARTTDAHLHHMNKLRIGARLATPEGEWSIVRRKGNKHTLLGVDGEPADEARLEALLRGLSAERFESGFCLGHDTLRAGGEQLSQALGDVGESLFDAGLGGRGVHQVLAALTAEAGELWAPRGSTRPLNRALKAFKEAGQRGRERELSSSAYKAARREQRDLSARRDALAEQLAALASALRRLRRAEAVLPLLIQHAELLRQRDELGAVPVLDDGAATRRQQAQDARRTAAAAGEVHAVELAGLGEQLAALGEEPDGEPLDPGELNELEQKLSRHVTALEDRPKLVGRATQHEAELARALHGLGDPCPPDAAQSLLLEDGLVRRIRELARRRGELHGARDHQRRQVERARAEGERLAGLSLEAPAEQTVSALTAALAMVEQLGDVGDRVARLAAGRRAAEARQRELFHALQPRASTAEETVALAVPERERLAHFASERADLDRRAEQWAERRDAGAARQAEAAHQLALDEAGGDVPDRERLDETRGRRDEQWRALRQGADPSGPPGDVFEQLQSEADAVADRLVREAESVERRALLKAEGERAAAELRACEQALDELADERGEHDQRWQALWTATGLTAGQPSERLEWRRAWSALGQAVGEARAAADEQQAYLERLAGAAEHLGAVLVAGGLELPAGDDLSVDQRLATWVTRARVQLAALDEQRRAAQQHVEALAAADARQRAAEELLAAAEAELAAWTEAWAQALEPVGLAPESTAEQVEQHLDLREAVSRAWEKRTDSRQRLSGMDADDAALAQRLSRLEAGRPQADPGAALEPRARALLAWQAALAETRRQRAALSERRQVAEQALERSRQQVRRADEQLAAACVAAGCEHPDQLPAVEQRVTAARDLDARLAALTEQLAVAGDGATLASLREACAGLEQAAVKESLRDHEQQVASLDEELRAIEGELGRLASRLEERDGPSAADAAVEAQGHLADVRAQARRWATLRLASVLLEQQIERYREEHQGPVLRRVDELFPRLTDGRYRQVRAEADEDGRAHFLVSRDEGEWLGVEALSDGTRDQLFLALKVASLERQAQVDEPFPLVLDDVLVHFDDRRTVLALELLGELARSTQVLLFTHHRRVLELAREALPDGGLVEHELAPTADAG